MQLPKKWKDFQKQVVEKVNFLCKANIWTLREPEVSSWLNNFKKDEHRYLALHMLDRLTFRNKQMTLSSYERYFCSEFKQLAEHKLNITHSSLSDWMSKIHYSGNFIISPLREKTDAGESGDSVFRLITGEIIQNRKRIAANIDSLNESASGKVILIVDDFIGSGDQFNAFAEANNLKELSENNLVIFAPVIAFEDGLKAINEKKWGIAVTPLEIISSREQFISRDKDACFKGDSCGTPESEIMNILEDIKKENQINMEHWLGRDNTALTVGFEWGTPNQTLGAMTFGNNAWYKLLKRRA